MHTRGGEPASLAYTIGQHRGAVGVPPVCSRRCPVEGLDVFHQQHGADRRPGRLPASGIERYVYLAYVDTYNPSASQEFDDLKLAYRPTLTGTWQVLTGTSYFDNPSFHIPRLALDSQGDLYVAWRSSIFQWSKAAGAWQDNEDLLDSIQYDDTPGCRLDLIMDRGDVPRWIGLLAAGGSDVVIGGDLGDIYFHQNSPCNPGLELGVDGTLVAVWESYDSTTEVEVLDFAEQTDSVTKHYYLTPGQRIATRVDGEVYYIHSDHLGSTSLVTDDSGNEVSRVQYSPYGTIISSTGTVSPTDRLFTGQRFEGGIQLYDYRARFYDPLVGSFISADTIVPEPGHPRGFNRYSYVYGNPIRYTDPSGHCGEDGDEPCWSAAEQLDLKYGIGLEYVGQLSYQQLATNPNLAAVLAFTLNQNDLVNSGQTTDAEALVAILAFSVENAAGGNAVTGLRYVSSVFWRHEIQNYLISGYAYRSIVRNPRRFLDSGFDSRFVEQERNQLEHFISEAYLSIILFPNGSEPTIHSLQNIDLGWLIPLYQEIRQWANPNDAGGAWTNINFVPDLRLGLVGVGFADVLQLTNTPEDRAKVYESLLFELTNPPQ